MKPIKAKSKWRKRVDASINVAFFVLIVAVPIAVLVSINHAIPYGELSIEEKKKVATNVYTRLKQEVSREFSNIAIFTVNVDNIAKATARGYVFKGTKDVNILTAAQYRIDISTGMLNFLKSEEEVAFILAHEWAHVILGHTLHKPTIFRASNEVVADKLAIYLMLKSGYRVCVASALWARKAKVDGSYLFQTTHPLHTQRAAYLKFPHCK